MGDSLRRGEGSSEDCQEPGDNRRQRARVDRGLQELAPPPVSSGESPWLSGNTGSMESGLLSIKH